MFLALIIDILADFKTKLRDLNSVSSEKNTWVLNNWTFQGLRTPSRTHLRAIWTPANPYLYSKNQVCCKVGKNPGFMSIVQPSVFYWKNPGFTRVILGFTGLLGNKNYESHPTPSSPS